MRCWNKLVLFALVLMFALAYVAAAQEVKITSGPTLNTVASNAVVIGWTTNLPSSSRVWYGKDKNNLTHLAESPETGSSNHRVTISNLEPNTTYYFQVESGRGKPQNEAESEGVLSFKTTSAGAQPVHNETSKVAQSDVAAGDVENGKVKITNGPVIEEADSTHAQIAWSTNIKGSTRVTYGTDANNLTQLAEAPWGVGGSTHRVVLKNLKPGTTYYFQVETGQAAGSEVESHIFSFRTPNQGEPPIRQEQPKPVR